MPKKIKSQHLGDKKMKVTTELKKTKQKELMECLNCLQADLQALPLEQTSAALEYCKELKIVFYAYSEILRISEDAVSWFKRAAFDKVHIHITRLSRYFHILEETNATELLKALENEIKPLNNGTNALSTLCYMEALIKSYAEVLRLAKGLFLQNLDVQCKEELDFYIKPLRVELFKIYRSK